MRRSATCQCKGRATSSSREATGSSRKTRLVRSSSRLTLYYALGLSALFVLELSAGVLAYLYRGQVGQEVAEGLQDKFQVEYGEVKETTGAVDHLQIS